MRTCNYNFKSFFAAEAHKEDCRCVWLVHVRSTLNLSNHTPSITQQTRCTSMRYAAHEVMGNFKIPCLPEKDFQLLGRPM